MVAKEHVLGTVPTIAQVVQELGGTHQLMVNKHRTVQGVAVVDICQIGMQRLDKMRARLDALGWGYAYNAEPPRPNCTDYRSVIITASI